MSFSESLKKIFKKKEKKEPQTPAEKIKEFFRQLFYAAIAAFFIITFIIQNTRIPTGSMEDTILVGDFVLVNKFIYGSSSPRYIPFTEVPLPYFTLPAIKDPKPTDIVVFEYPGDRDQLEPTEKGVNYVKRCIGIPGDTVEIIDKVVFVNGKEFWRPPYIKYYRGMIGPNLRPLPKGYAEPRIFPRGMPWNEDNYGPLVVPKKGMTIPINIYNVEQWQTTIDREFGKRVVEIRGNVVYIDGQPASSYTFKKDYYFMMGDNRDDSLDSRFWGFVPRDAVVGEAFIILFSWDREIPFSELFRLLASVRTDRILKLIH
ncbi:MAG: signal peptidase I [Ignavibacterium album]|uniref:signal peptidase I n=1 Tax=Ignavibacterium album TaxID=591197 RepID=UPI0026F0B56B|nr:signal peptidase I [Ignavibacterium album]MBI5661364.1 signal peptidase I [Ignavibacterium album]